MDVIQIKSLLAGLPVPEIRYFESIASTNDEALKWATSGAEDGCLVIADQQTLGRGRLGRRWITRPGSALAFSLILHPTSPELKRVGFFSPLGALAICQALEKDLKLPAEIKWPNDVLLGRRKAAGILVEAAWQGETLQGIVIGIGINVAAEAVPPADQLLFPATSIEDAAGRAVDRWRLLRAILQSIFDWRSDLCNDTFYQTWQSRLAFRGEWVRVEESTNLAGAGPLTGQVVGIDTSGSLLLQTQAGQIVSVAVGDVHLRLMH